MTAGRAAIKQGRYADAEPLLTSALSNAPVDSADSAECMNEVGRLDFLTAKYEEAENFDRKAMALEEKLLGKDSPAVATSLEQLGELDNTRARLEPAEKEFRRALEIRTKSLGEENADTAETMSNLGYCLLTGSRLDEAQKFCRRAVDIEEKVLPADDTRLAIGWDNLANYYYLHSDLVQAEAMFLKSLHLRTAQLGEDHPDVGQSYDNLGWLYMEWGDFPKAKRYFNLARFTRENSLGAEHPDTISSHAAYVDLASPDPIKNEDAAAMLEKDLAAEMRFLGAGHWTTQYIEVSLAQDYAQMQRVEDARKLFNDALASSRKSFGENNFNTAVLESEVGDFDAGAGGKPDDAEPLYKQSIATLEKLLGKEDRSLSGVLNSYAALLKTKNRDAEAKVLNDRADAIDALDKKRNPMIQVTGPGL